MPKNKNNSKQSQKTQKNKASARKRNRKAPDPGKVKADKRNAKNGQRGHGYGTTQPINGATIDPVTSDNDTGNTGPYTFFSINGGRAYLWRPHADYNLFYAAHQNQSKLDGYYENATTETANGNPNQPSHWLLSSYSIHP